ncbi:MAG TPA: hypothetical protein VF114_08975 [Candidatus Limnocylindria bacterium]
MSGPIQTPLTDEGEALMDLAITIFWIGVGAGALLVGIGVIMIAVSLRPVARDIRALANDTRRLTRLAESEMTILIGRTREIADGTEQLSSELAHELDALKAQTDALEHRVLEEPAVRMETSVPASEAVPIGEPQAPADPIGRQPVGSVQSPHAREDEQIA